MLQHLGLRNSLFFRGGGWGWGPGSGWSPYSGWVTWAGEGSVSRGWARENTETVCKETVCGGRRRRRRRRGS
eukprot:885750-Rhodomonas_salina.1